MKKTAPLALGASVALAVTLVACDSTDKLTEPFRDAPRSQVADYTPMDVIGNADGFSNVGTKCDGYGNRVAVIFKGNELYGSLEYVGNADLADQDPCKRDFHNVRGN